LPPDRAAAVAAAFVPAGRAVTTERQAT